jgi:hypothetical protein
MSTISASTTSTTAYKVTADTTGALVLQTGATPTTAVTIDTSQNTTLSGYLNTPNTFGFKNRIINGGMVIDQRNAGASVTVTTAQIYPVDRFFGQGSITSKFTAQQSSTATTGFNNSLLLTSSAATTPGASDYYYIAQVIEGYNIADFGFGTASASTITLSFWVRSSLTGTFSGALLNSAANRSYAFTYTINAANTFEQKTVTIAGDTSGTWLTTNGIGTTVRFALGAGSSFLQTANAWSTGNVVGATGTTQWISTSGATFYVTGVQLEKGSTATSFDYRPYSTELALAQRYCLVKSQANGATTMGNGWWNGSTTAALLWMAFPVSMRSAPTASQNGGTWKQEGIASSFTATGTIQGSTFGTDGGWINWNAISGGTGTSAQPTGAEITSSLTMVLTLSSEL